MILSAGASIVEQVKWKKPSRPMGVLVWSRDGNICIGEALKSAVRLTFPKGAPLKDPEHVFNTRLDSAAVRAVDVREGDMVNEAAGQAAAVATHELGAAAYALKAVHAAAPEGAGDSAGRLECLRQRDQLPEAIRELVPGDQRLRQRHLLVNVGPPRAASGRQHCPASAVC